MRRDASVVLSALVLAGIATSCEFDPGALAGPIWPCFCWETDVVEITASRYEIVAGDSVRLSAVARRVDGTIDSTARIGWRSSDTTVAAVSATGWVTGRRPGAVEITATAAEFSSGLARIGVTVGPSASPLDLDLIGIAAGSANTCALDASGSAWCWGLGHMGELGIGHMPAERWTPSRVASDVRFTRLSAGGAAMCALDAGGLAWCWGSNSSAQLGDGTFEPRSAPTPVHGGEAWDAIDAGWWATCALRSTGRVRCWGTDDGVFGTGTYGTASTVPVDAVGSLTFTSLGVGLAHACGIESGGRLLCWGQPGSGVLGRPNAEDVAAPAPVQSTATFRAMATSPTLACALDDDGAPHCWGWMLGDPVHVPTRVSTTERFASVVTGLGFACALTADGRAFCWGSNFSGQLGNGTFEHSLQPRAVGGGHRFAMLTAGSAHACGIATDGAPWCWGDNANGQLGTGGRSLSTLPVRVVQWP